MWITNRGTLLFDLAARLTIAFVAALTVGVGFGMGLAGQMRAAPEAQRLPDTPFAASEVIELDGRLPVAPTPPVVLWPLIEGPDLDTALSARERRHDLDPPDEELIEPAAPPREAAPQQQSELWPAAPFLQPASFVVGLMSGVPAAGPRIAIVMDDVGFGLDRARRIVDLPEPVTVAVLPAAPDATAAALLAQARGLRVILHMPMEPDGPEQMGPIGVRRGMAPASMTAMLEKALARVPGAIGVNNHMGSRFTRDAAALTPVLLRIGDHGLFFLDSRTSGESVAYETARALGLPALKRDVFLDHTLDRRDVLARLRETEAAAILNGVAIAIGHPHDVTLETLELWIPGAARRGFRFVMLDELVGPARQARGIAASLPPA